MNMTAIRYGEDIIVVDCGMMFPDAELLGVDLVMPDLTFLKENQAQVRAVILTHGHEDHIGAVPYFLSEIDVPVYGTAFTLALVERRLEEYDLEKEPRLIKVKPKQTIADRPVQDRVHPRHALHCERRGPGHHHAARRDHPHRRFQSGPHADGQRAVRPAHAGRLRQARRPAAALRFHQFRPAGIHRERARRAAAHGRDLQPRPRSGSWFPVSALRFTASNWCSTWRRNTAGAWR